MTEIIIREVPTAVLLIALHFADATSLAPQTPAGLLDFGC
jgi:hypothetical protein